MQLYPIKASSLTEMIKGTPERTRGGTLMSFAVSFDLQSKVKV